MAAIERPLVMIPMQWIQAFVEEPANQTLPRKKAAMKHIPVKQVLHQGSSEAADDVESHSEPWIVRKEPENQDCRGVQCVEHCQGVQLVPRERSLAPLIDRKGNIG